MKLIETILVDDDQLALEYIEELIDWQAAGFHIAGRALDGEQGYRLYQRVRPKLVIADVRMPVMDGIALAERILQDGRGACVLLLSNFDEFSYVRQAMRAGIRDYILKHELDAPSLLEKLSSVKMELSQKERENWDATESFIRAQFTWSEPPLPKNQTESDLLHRQFQYLLVREALPFLELVQLCGGREQPANNLAELIRTGWTRPEQVGCVTAVGRGIFAVVLEAENKTSAVESQQKMFFSAQKLSRFLENHLGHPCSVFTVSAPCTLPFAAALWKKFSRALDACCFFEEGLTGEWEEFARQQSSSRALPCTAAGGEPYTLLKESVRVQNYPLFLQSARQVLRQILTDPAQSVFDPAQEPAGWYSAQAFLTWAGGRLAQAHPNWSQPVREAVAYIHEQYRDPNLSVQRIAQHAAVSRSHLSALFRAEAGSGVNEYLAQYRIDQAAALMETGRYKIYEISEMVGYSSSQYFCRVFKKLKGYPPRTERRGRD